jgi:hypothetical protein
MAWKGGLSEKLSFAGRTIKDHATKEVVERDDW